MEVRGSVWGHGMAREGVDFRAGMVARSPNPFPPPKPFPQLGASWTGTSNFTDAVI